MSKKIKAFTLIEILIVVAILAVLSAVSWLNLNNSKKSADVGNACSQVAAYINKARNYAVSGTVKSATVTVSGKEINVSITPNSGTVTSESYMLKGDVSCSSSSSSFSYLAPNGVGVSGTIKCSSSDGSVKTVIVTPYQAVCN